MKNTEYDKWIEKPCANCDCTGWVTVANGKWVRKTREDERISLREVARRVGISAAYLSDIELGKRAVSEKVMTFMEKVAKGNY